METSTDPHIRGAIEALLFISEKPVMLEQIREILPTISTTEIRQAIHEIRNEYEENTRGMGIVEIAGGYQMLSNPKYADYVRNFFKSRVKEKLTKPALETLAIIAYKQPVTRSDIEMIRGVNSDGVVTHLMNKGLIKMVGRRDVPGRPYLYGTTRLFLEYFGLKALEGLPQIEEFSSLVPASEAGEGGNEAGAGPLAVESEAGKEAATKEEVIEK